MVTSEQVVKSGVLGREEDMSGLTGWGALGPEHP